MNQKTDNEGTEFDFNFDATAFDCSFDFETMDAGPGAKTKPAKIKPGEAIGVGTRTRIVTNSTGQPLFLNALGVKNAADLIQELPRPGQILHALMGGDFHAWDLIPAMHRLMGCSIAELYITTLGFNHSNNQQLCEMLDAGAVEKVTVLCSAYFKGADADVYNAAKERLEKRGQRITAIRNHSKVLLLKPAKGSDRFAIETSANLRSCNNVEQLTLFNCAATYDFHKAWIDKAVTL